MAAPERAFTRRQAGVNPIALELDRLAEQRALQTLGRRGGMLPRSADQTATDAPLFTEEELANDEAYARFMQRMPTRATATPEQIDAGQYIPDPQEVAQHSAFLDEMRGRGLNFDPSDPRWGGLEEDEAYDQLFAMHPAQREAFLRMMLGGKP